MACRRFPGPACPGPAHDDHGCRLGARRRSHARLGMDAASCVGGSMGSHARVGVAPGLTARLTEVHVRSPFGSRYAHDVRLGKAPGTPGQPAAPAPPLVNPIAFALGAPMDVAAEYGALVRQRLGPLTRMEGVIGHLAQPPRSNSVARSGTPQCVSFAYYESKAAFGIEICETLTRCELSHSAAAPIWT